MIVEWQSIDGKHGGESGPTVAPMPVVPAAADARKPRFTLGGVGGNNKSAKSYGVVRRAAAARA